MSPTSRPGGLRKALQTQPSDDLAEIIKGLVQFTSHSYRCGMEPCTCGLQKVYDKIDALIDD